MEAECEMAILKITFWFDLRVIAHFFCPEYQP